MEALDTDLRHIIEKGASCMNEEHVNIIIYNTLCALKFLHSCNIVHRDIKPSNILVSRDCQVMICDFGLARSLPESCIGKGTCNTKRIRETILLNSQKMSFENTKLKSEDDLKKIVVQKIESKRSTGEPKRSLSSHVGSRWYRAPEIAIMEKKYDTASDLWSAGCCFYELLQSVNAKKT